MVNVLCFTHESQVQVNEEVSITVLVNDEARSQELKEVHGLSIYIESKSKTILFDTGPSPEILESNSEKIGIDLSFVEDIVISHIHSDHLGGIPYMGWVAPSINVYLPYGVSSSITGFIKKQGLVPIEIVDWTKIYSGIIVSKPLYGPPWEQFLIIKSNNGLILFTGCSHPGINNVVNSVIEYLNNNVYAVVGGLHLVNAPDEVLKNTIDEPLSRIEILVPLHCTGKRAIEYALKKYRSKVLLMKAGDTIKI